MTNEWKSDHIQFTLYLNLDMVGNLNNKNTGYFYTRFGIRSFFVASLEMH